MSRDQDQRRGYKVRYIKEQGTPRTEAREESEIDTTRAVTLTYLEGMRPHEFHEQGLTPTQQPECFAGKLKGLLHTMELESRKQIPCLVLSLHTQGGHRAGISSVVPSTSFEQDGLVSETKHVYMSELRMVERERSNANPDVQEHEEFTSHSLGGIQSGANLKYRDPHVPRTSVPGLDKVCWRPNINAK